MKSKRQWMANNRIETREPFNKLFPIDEKTIDAIAEHMQTNGYDESQPIIIWDQSSPESKHALYVIDGHTRLLAAKKAGLSPVYIARMDFPDDQTALQYAIHNQRDRRNITDSDIMRCVKMLDKRKEAQKDDTGKFTVGSSEPTGRTAEKTASIIGTSSTKVKKARTILDHADDETKQAVKSGDTSIHKAYTEIQKKRREHAKKEEIENPDFNLKKKGLDVEAERYWLNMSRRINKLTKKIKTNGHFNKNISETCVEKMVESLEGLLLTLNRFEKEITYGWKK